MSRCANCGNATKMDKEQSDSTTTLGDEFTEIHFCPECGARGQLKGVVGQPEERWNWTGMVFNA